MPLALSGASFILYGAPVLADVVQGLRWSLTSAFVAFHIVPGAFVGAIAVWQILAGVGRLSADGAMLGGVAMVFGPGLGPVIGILHLHTGLIWIVIAYHLIPGAMAFWVGLRQMGQLSHSRPPTRADAVLAAE